MSILLNIFVWRVSNFPRSYLEFWGDFDEIKLLSRDFCSLTGLYFQRSYLKSDFLKWADFVSWIGQFGRKWVFFGLVLCLAISSLSLFLNGIFSSWTLPVSSPDCLLKFDNVLYCTCVWGVSLPVVNDFLLVFRLMNLWFNVRSPILGNGSLSRDIPQVSSAKTLLMRSSISFIVATALQSGRNYKRICYSLR